MTLPLFSTTEDPGPDFAGLIRKLQVPLRHPAPLGPAGATAAAGRLPARDHGGGAAIGGRHRHGRRPAGHRGPRHRPPVDARRCSRRPLLGRGHRRCGRPRRRDGPALPDPARALREGGGGGPQPRGQGQPARSDGAGAPAHGHAGPGRGPSVRRLRPGPPDGPHLHLRRDRWSLRGDRAQRHRIRRAGRPDHHQTRLPGGDGTATRRWSWPSRPSTRRPTRTRPPGDPT